MSAAAPCQPAASAASGCACIACWSRVTSSEAPSSASSRSRSIRTCGGVAAARGVVRFRSERATSSAKAHEAKPEAQFRTTFVNRVVILVDIVSCLSKDNLSKVVQVAPDDIPESEAA